VPLFKTLPAVNQVECNPLFQQRELREVLDPLGVVLECWYPLGHGNTELLGNPAITALAEKYGKNAGQIVLRFETQDGLVTLPKSTNPGRIASNLDVFDFELTDAEMDALRALDTGKGTHDPEDPVNEERLLAFRVH
jgi:diketogulonate reductase-like aldo/keto reductase